ncbi:enolase C-terminal domain-like protein [Massilia sp. CCM 9210]|uniref:mandelate racemase/muconate lactonizing enzyme family protein n=1 Tax=Massilia scottii TaxID=3057166 RepID=UPI002796AD53|nr:enolase C-terminal domain-like protein [Massilia sp. CCM 9210]MDQ1813501.1 enolase C-terminal domain-like protein [Massilia sp. CCM 9210]
MVRPHWRDVLMADFSPESARGAPLTIVRVEAWKVRMPYGAPMQSSRGRLEVGEKVLLRLTALDGTVGLGEASIIFPARDGECADSVFRRLAEVSGPLLLGQDGARIVTILQTLAGLSSERHAFPTSLCAIDLALHDLKARHLGIPVADLLGGATRERFALSRSMAMPDERTAVQSACTLAEMGYRLLTLKGSADWRHDIRMARAVQRAVGAGVRIEIDPNQAWHCKAALAVDAALQECELECIEQPCAWWDIEAMQLITERAHAPIAADESVLSPADAMRVVRARAADIITVKLAKSGGLRASSAIVAIAEAGGLQCNLGSKHTLGVGSAALLHFAAAHPAVGEFVGYGSALERFVGDIINETIDISDGQARLPPGPGFGVTLNDEAIARFALASADLSAERTRAR